MIDRADRWTAGEIGGAVARQILHRKCLVLIDNSYWTGYEADLLGVTMDRRLIDVEVKISRADLRADAVKDKWWKRDITGYEAEHDVTGAVRVRRAVYSREARPWPPKIWKHYYALPASIWKPELAAALASANSGVLLFRRSQYGHVHIHCERRARPRSDATQRGAGAGCGQARQPADVGCLRQGRRARDQRRPAGARRSRGAAVIVTAKLDAATLVLILYIVGSLCFLAGSVIALVLRMATP